TPFRRELQRRHPDGELSLLGGHHDAARADDVAEVDVLQERERLVVERVLRAEELDISRPIAQREEHELPEAASENDPPRDRNLVVRGRLRVEILVASMELCRVRGRLEGERERLHAALPEVL